MENQNMIDIQERVIISEVLDGQQDQYRFLVERYHRGLIQHLYNLTHDQDLAEDLAQESFIRAYNKLSQYNEEYAFSTWLYKIADNITYRQFKQRKATTDIEPLKELISDHKPSLPEQTDQMLTRQAVRGAVDALPADYKQVVALYYWDGFSYEEISQIIDRPIGTVRTWLFRAKEELRKELYGQA